MNRKNLSNPILNFALGSHYEILFKYYITECNKNLIFHIHRTRKHGELVTQVYKAIERSENFEQEIISKTAQ